MTHTHLLAPVIWVDAWKKVPLEKEDRMGPQGSSQRSGLHAPTAFS